MSDDETTIMDMKFALEASRASGWPGAGDDLEQQIKREVSENEFYVGLRTRLCEMSTNPREAFSIFSRNEIYWTEGGVEKRAFFGLAGMKLGAQKLRIFATALVQTGLLSAEKIKGIDFNYRDVEGIAKEVEAYKEAEAIKKARAALIDVAADGDPYRRRQALAVYNRLPEGWLSWDKLGQFTRNLVNEKLLGIEYLPGRKFGNFIQKFKR